MSTEEWILHTTEWQISEQQHRAAEIGASTYSSRNNEVVIQSGKNNRAAETERT
jgi:hypothetical protein